LSKNTSPEKILGVYSTTSGSSYPLEFGYSILASSDVPIDIFSVRNACKTGCNLFGRNGGCPPFAPDFPAISRSALFVFYAKLLTRYYPAKVLNGNYYTRWVFVETFLTSLTTKIGKKVAITTDGVFLASGNCHTCRPRRCAVKEGKPCRDIANRTFSLEATGVLLSRLIPNIFSFDLQWWKKNDHNFTPDYMVKAVGITSNNLEEIPDLANKIKAILLECNVVPI
jgi:predicted metal-binding protein